MAAKISGLAVAQATAGFVLLWSGLRNTSIKATLTGFASGKVPAGSPTGAPTIGISSASGSGGTAAASGAASAAGGSAKANQAIGKMLATSYGWGSGAEWNALLQLWDGESGWNNKVWNGGSTAATEPAGSSGAYGIPQALPYTKMPKAAWPPGYGGSAAAGAQISWGLSYIKSTYGTPSAALAFDQSHGGY